MIGYNELTIYARTKIVYTIESVHFALEVCGEDSITYKRSSRQAVKHFNKLNSIAQEYWRVQAVRIYSK